MSNLDLTKILSKKYKELQKLESTLDSMEQNREKQERRIQVGDRKSRAVLTSGSWVTSHISECNPLFLLQMLHHCVK